ncbi:MAG TPA: heavy-metal-associated domain-containing protein [Candidatus Limnocylindrales bacterium]|nr:heavy-metal-associated domain-containing protein [Candidatus Limnocylindrales bacterium]
MSDRVGRTPEEEVRIPVSGMVCGSCVGRITRAVRGLDGVHSVRVDLSLEAVTVRREPASVSDAQLAAAITVAGYDADLAALETRLVDRDRGLLARLLGRG